MPAADDFEDAVRAHDAAVAAGGQEIWVGSEPTFTDRFADTPEWLVAALGGDKEARAQALLRALYARWPGALVLRPEGRRYPHETAPRWSLGLLRRRDGVPLWDGPSDPLLAGDREPRVHETLPDFGADVAAFQDHLATLRQRALRGGAGTLVFDGCTPPVDPTLALSTITPDPAVIEVNAAPSTCAFDFLLRSRRIYAAAAGEGLCPYRLRFNGEVADSGGGGQITLGGPTPATSPFIREPRLLPRLVRFFNRHPSLSYLYCHDFVGPGGQSVRADERGPAAFDELRLALALVDADRHLTPERAAQALAHFLADAGGNSHRAEINIEKLCNPRAGPRGMQGLVEFRALRMQHTPERATAIACLLRSVAAMLAGAPYDEPLVDWGRELHDRLALPLYLEHDLQAVLDCLCAAGFGLDAAIVDLLRADEFRHHADVVLPGATLEIRRALEFWPLVGDVTSAEQAGTARRIDGSTTRLELRLRARDASAAPWRITAAGRALPWRDEHDAHDPVRVAGLRYRAFEPTQGLHPALLGQAPVVLQLQHPARPEALALTLHEWHPDGIAYPGVPEDLADAARRRAERVVLQALDAAAVDAASDAPHPGPMRHGLDLRWPA